jgi:SAM-dependent methyltransferase
VADVGAGTGIFTASLLATGARVSAVEPNAPMRQALVASLGEHARLTVHAGSAEATGLPAGSVDLVTAAQAFHWFDAAAARRECARILRPGGRVALVWNNRVDDTTPFLRAYEDLLRRRGTDYAEVDHRRGQAERLAAFFGPGAAVEHHLFDNHQVLDAAGLRARLLSSSYAPMPGHPDHEPMLAELDAIVAAHGRDGRVVLEYRTELVLGRLGAEGARS